MLMCSKRSTHPRAASRPAGLLPNANGRPGTDADWQALMGEVETLGVELGEPGFFYPFGIWDLGLDNARVTRLLPQP